MKVVIWNEYKMHCYYEGSLGTNTYAGLQDYETTTGNSLSSVIEVNDEEQLSKFLEAVHNETDVELCSHVLPEEPAKVREPTALEKYAALEDRRLVDSLVKHILAKGDVISIFDGEEYTINSSNDAVAIKREMAGTGEDSLEIYQKDGTHMGSFYLIYNNGSEGEPMVCICDHSANEYCDEIYNLLDQEFNV